MALKVLAHIERSKTGFCAYTPDLPMVLVAGKNWDETYRLIVEGVYIHLESFLENGSSIPEQPYYDNVAVGQPAKAYVITVKQTESSFFISSPEFPSVTVSAATLDAGRQLMHEALTSYIESRRKRRKRLRKRPRFVLIDVDSSRISLEK